MSEGLEVQDSVLGPDHVVVNNVSVECLLAAQDVCQHRPRDHIVRPIIFGRDVENAVDDAVHELFVDREAWLELWEEGQEVIPVGRGEVRHDGAVLQPRRLVDLLTDLSRGVLVHELAYPARRGDSHRMSE